MNKPRDIPIKKITDDLYNIFFTELHPPYMNYMGPKTKIEDRISLNYDVRPISKGTENYMIPTSESDYYSFIHDLLYYSPNDTVKFNADKKYISDVKSSIGLLGIGAQFLKRGVTTFSELGFNLNNLYKVIMGNIDVIERLVTTRQINIVDFLKNVVFPGYISASFLYPNTKESYRKSLEKIYNQFVSKKEFNVVLDEVNKVKNKLDKYLDTVGQYKPITSKTSEKYFTVDKNIDTEKSKKAYEEFYNQVVEYFNFINNKYKDKPGYTQVEIPPLNMNRIEDASNPKQVSRTIDEMITKTIEGATEEVKEFFQKYKDEIERKKRETKEKETKEKIEKLLKGYIDVPFEIPLEPKQPERIDYGIDFEDEIPEGMTVKEYIIQLGKQEKKEYDEEILKVLKGEQDVMFETPVEISTPIEIVKGLSKGSVIESMPSEKLVVTEQPEFMNYDFEAMNNMVEVEIQPSPSPYMYYGMDAI